MKMAAIERASEAYKGYCVKCGKITRGECEPDARDYPCPKCKTNSVVGIEEGVMMGVIPVT
jgi:Zn finger protein HypA/HybF involved in hydrogenase expression